MQKAIGEAKIKIEDELSLFSSPIVKSFLSAVFSRCDVCRKRLLERLLLSKYPECSSCEPAVRLLKEPLYSFLASLNNSEKKEFLESVNNELKERTFAAMTKGFSDFGVRLPPVFPYRISWELTHRCNLKCEHCYAASPKELTELDTNEALNFVKDLADVGFQVIGFTGGEPLLREDLSILVRETADYGMMPTLDTNGTLLTKDNVNKLAKAGIGDLLISLDSADPATHDKFRGVEGAFQRAVEGIKNGVDAGLAVYLNTLISRLNYRNIEDMITLAKNIRATGISFINFIPIGRGAQSKAELSLKPAELYETLSTIRENQRKGSELVLLYDKLPGDLYDRVQSLSVEEFMTLFITGGDHDGRLQINVTPDGYVQPSCFLRINVGNIRHNSLKEIWTRSEILENLRDRSKLKGACGNCLFKYICGGSRPLAYSITGDYLAEDPMCPAVTSAHSS